MGQALVQNAALTPVVFTEAIMSMHACCWLTTGVQSKNQRVECTSYILLTFSLILLAGATVSLDSTQQTVNEGSSGRSEHSVCVTLLNTQQELARDVELLLNTVEGTAGESHIPKSEMEAMKDGIYPGLWYRQ